jgi:hypothetical protein
MRADLPINMNSDVKTLIAKCWSGKPDERWSFSKIFAELKRIRFQILPEVNSIVVEQYLLDIHHQHGQPKRKCIILNSKPSQIICFVFRTRQSFLDGHSN